MNDLAYAFALCDSLTSRETGPKPVWTGVAPQAA